VQFNFKFDPDLLPKNSIVATALFELGAYILYRRCKQCSEMNDLDLLSKNSLFALALFELVAYILYRWCKLYSEINA
jgi:hypothetical protein